MPARLVPTKIPEFGDPTVEPQVPAATFAKRQEAAADRAAQAGLDALVVYGDREHAANLAWLTGYDPRFEEALLVMVPGQTPHLLIGNEGWGYAELAPAPFERLLWQTLSLPGQPRTAVPTLTDLLRQAGLRGGETIGAVGWKPFAASDSGADRHSLDLPAFVADPLRDLGGGRDRVVNANALFMDPDAGLRAINDVDQLACFEFAACFTSDAVKGALLALRPGITEIEAARAMRLPGLAHSCHTMLSAGPRARAGLCSPGLRPIERGDPVTMACGITGALNARAGFLANDAADLPRDAADWLDRLVVPYFEAAAAWWQTLAIDRPAGALWSAVHERIGDPFFGVSLNPGHLIGHEEWMHSAVTRGSESRLRSGMALQCDIIPATGGPYFTTNIEDGLALADDALRAAFASRYPEAWKRIAARRRWLEETIGIRLAPEVLPFSSIAGWLTPFLLDPHHAMRLV